MTRSHEHLRAYQFKPGQVGNPAGGPKLSPEVRALRNENKESLIRLVHRFLNYTPQEADERMLADDVKQIEKAVQGQIIEARAGDAKTFQYLMEILCGKIPEVDPEESIADKLSPHERLEAARMLIKVLEQEAADDEQTRK